MSKSQLQAALEIAAIMKANRERNEKVEAAKKIEKKAWNLLSYHPTFNAIRKLIGK